MIGTAPLPKKPVETPVETPKTPLVEPEPPVETPKTPESALPVQPPAEDLSAEQLIDRSKELLAMHEQKTIEDRRKDRRNPM